MSIERIINGFRFVETNRGDTLQTIAVRELGDAARWPELVSFNGLKPPFLTDDPAQERTGVLLTGRLIKVPAAESQVTAQQDADLVFERDVQLSAGSLTADGGDFALVAGLGNLRQALSNRLQTDRGELPFHPLYGSLLRRIVGTANGPTAGLLAASYAKATVRQDNRISKVKTSQASVQGDRVTVQVIAEPIVGRAVDLTTTI